MTFFDEHYYDLETVRLGTKAAIQASIVLGVGFAIALFVLLIVRRAYAPAAFWGLAIAGSIALTRLLKELVERPEIGARQAEYSFPSGNAAVGLAGLFALAILVGAGRRRQWIALAALVILPLYGVSLVMLLWHYPTDVVGGWALGLAWVSALAVAFGDRIERRAPIVRRLP